MLDIKNARPLAICGTVLPNERDKSGNIVQVCIETENFKRYIVADDSIGRELLNCLNSKVKVIGLIAGEYFDSSEIVFVTKYQVINRDRNESEILIQSRFSKTH
jgi:hypothetical protein